MPEEKGTAGGKKTPLENVREGTPVHCPDESSPHPITYPCEKEDKQIWNKNHMMNVILSFINIRLVDQGSVIGLVIVLPNFFMVIVPLENSSCF